VCDERDSGHEVVRTGVDVARLTRPGVDDLSKHVFTE
jgi:hypothetical protein